MYRFLYVEDNATDVFLLNELINGGSAPPPCRLEHVRTLNEGLAALEVSGFDGVLLDLTLPDSRGMDTLVKVCAAAPKLPVLVLTSTDDMGLGVKSLEHGAQDYLVKDQLTRRSFARAIEYSIERKRLTQELERRYRELEAAQAEVKRLQGLIRICSECKRVVNEQGHWEAIEAYVHAHSDADFTHGYCPECSRRFSEEVDRYHAAGGDHQSST